MIVPGNSSANSNRNIGVRPPPCDQPRSAAISPEVNLCPSLMIWAANLPSLRRWITFHGPSMRQGHARLVSKGLDDAVFDAFLGHFADTLKELGVPDGKIAEIAPIFMGARNEVLNR